MSDSRNQFRQSPSSEYSLDPFYETNYFMHDSREGIGDFGNYYSLLSDNLELAQEYEKSVWSVAQAFRDFSTVVKAPAKETRQTIDYVLSPVTAVLDEAGHER